MTTKESIQSAYIDSVLTTGTKPKSVYSFAKQNEMAEQEFYTFYGSFESIEMSIWTNLASTTLSASLGWLHFKRKSSWLLL